MAPPSSPVLVYGFDPLCGWCFAFRGVLRELREVLGDTVQWELACGGLVVGEREQPIGQMAQYLLEGEKILQQRAGISYGSGFRDGLLANGSWVSRSEPPCRAVLHAQELFGGRDALALGDELVRGFYEDGLPPDQEETLRRAAEKVGLDAAALLQHWREGPAATAGAMFAARQLGVRTYPSLFVRNGAMLQPIYEGFAPAAELRETVTQALGGLS
ncbi:MAG: hypothetical protein KDI16_00115 [Halioglobus sp.]|nr:hypothetical protein [Halioglobus sp.]